MNELAHYANRPFAFLWRYIHKRPAGHFAIVTAVLGAVGCSISTQYALKLLVDDLSGRAVNHPSPWPALAMLIVLITADNLLWRVASGVANWTFVSVTGDLRSDLFRYLTSHAPSYFTDRPAGTLTSRITATSNAIFAAENMFIWSVLPPCVAILGTMAYMFAVSIPMAGSMMIVTCTLVVLLYHLAARGTPLHLNFADRAASVDGEMVDVVANLPLVRSFGGIPREHRRFDHTVDHEMAARRGSLIYLEKLRLLHAVITVILIAVLLAWAIYLWQRGAITTGDVVLVSTLGLGILHATRDLAVALVDVTQHVARLTEAISTLLTPHELRDPSPAPRLLRKRGSISFENVHFTYLNDRVVFDGLSLHVPAGQRVGLIGESGGGKSTLFALLQRFYDLQDGHILIDGQDIARVTQASLRDVITVVPQDISLLNRSVMENIGYGCPDASFDSVLTAAAAARCSDFIEALPQGFATIIGDRGVKLSGGQRQRISIARAILKDAPILLLDEATSALDNESEAAIIHEALDQLMQERTVIAIAHRLATLRNFDRIIVLQAGRIIEDGPPNELMMRRGHYRTLIENEVARLANKAA